MIGRLTGSVAALTDCALIDVHGVGYEVHMPVPDLAALTVGEAATLTIETVVREDMIRLYGFRDPAGRDWFRLLQGVQGVGAKVALAVLSVLPPADLGTAIAAGDRTAISRAPGVGKRVAERIATELAGKGPAPATLPAAALAKTQAATPADEAAADALSALINLGYDPVRAKTAVDAARAEAPDAGPAPLIKAALKALAS